ncbi:MAG: Fic family protein [Candidatus Geothermarchaeales archaeon]
MLERGGFDSLPESVWKRSAVLNTWGSNAVEGSTITREEAERLLLDGMSVEGRPVRDVVETLQHEKAFRGLLDRRNREITLVTVLELYEDVFRGILPDAGQWRRVNVRIRGASFTPPRMEKVLREMEAWERSYRQRDLAGEETFSLAVWMHYEFERIHPLSDGNGRVGRLLLNLHFLRRNWPPVHVLPRHREEYLSSLNAAYRGDFSGMIELLMVLTASSLLDLLDQVGTAEDELIPLRVASEGSPYGDHYLALRCKQAELPALKTGREWRTSRRALRLYRMFGGRKRGRSRSS